MSTQPKFSPTQKEIISGLMAGCITTIITHPLDLLKIRIQLDHTSKTHMEAFKKIIKSLKDENTIIMIKKIYRGIFPNFLGSSISWAIYFGSYRKFKDLSHYLIKSVDVNKDSNLQSWHYLGSAFAAGSFTAFLTNPIWVLKTRILSTSKDTPGAYNGIIDGIKRIIKEESIFGFWKGLLPSLVGVSQGALQFTIYDTLKYQFKNDDYMMNKFKVFEYILMSCTSKIIATFITYPCQLIRSRLQDYGSINENKTIVQVLTKIYIKEGIFGFYKGIIPNIIRVLPTTCITFSVYEKMKTITYI